jgi:hypothetical protein
MSEQLQEIYKDPPTGSFIPILFILVVISLFGTLYADVQRKMLRQAGQEEPCNPRYVFFSGLLNPFQKDPWGATEKNFKRCISTNMYRDRELTKQIRTNRTLIQDNEASIKKTFEDGYNTVKNTTERNWNPVKGQTQRKSEDHTKEINQMYASQHSLHEKVKKKTVQLFHVLDSILKYIYSAIVIRLGREKMEMSIDAKHADIMNRYKVLYAQYTKAYEEYNAKSYKSSAQKAYELSKQYQALTEEIRQFRIDHGRNKIYIAKGCRRLNKVFNDTTHSKCLKIFPNLPYDTAASAYISQP